MMHQIKWFRHEYCWEQLGVSIGLSIDGCECPFHLVLPDLSFMVDA